MHNIVLLGAPGSGKGTQAKRLVQRYGFRWIALGELLRKQVAEASIHKPLIERYIDHGHLVPDSISFGLIAELVQAHVGAQSLLFDGFPRTLQQAVFLNHCLAAHRAQIDATVFLDVQETHLIQRLQERAAKEKRADDQDIQKIRTRMQTYQKETFPLIAYYQNQGKLHHLNGNEAEEKITPAIEAIVNGL